MIFHQFANIFKLSSEATQSYMERCFTVAIENKSFLELDFNVVSKLLASSELFVTSEREVLDAAYRWLSRDFGERGKFGARLLLKVRLRLLFSRDLKIIESSSLSSSENSRCHAMLKKAFESNELGATRKSRYCSQKSFGVLVCGGCLKTDHGMHRYDNPFNMKQFSFEPDLNCVRVHPSTNKNRKAFEAVYLKGDVYVFAGNPIYKYSCGDRDMSIEKYSLATESWAGVAVMGDRRRNYCVCAFVDKILLFGGFCWNERQWDRPCLRLNTTTRQLEEVSPMARFGRKEAACAVFEERIVVCGGAGGSGRCVNWADSYDVYEDAWTPMPDMVVERKCHKLVAVESKLFVIGGRFFTCEVYDGMSKKFVELRCPFPMERCQALSVGSKIFVFGSYTWVGSASYDFKEDKWSEESRDEITGAVLDFSCVKLPFYRQN